MKRFFLSQSTQRTIGMFLILFGLGIALYAFYQNSQYSQVRRTFSTYTTLESSWEKYKLGYMDKTGRVIDYSQGSVTTSEGQAYALLRALWIDDKATFDSVNYFTKINMKQKDSYLLGWRWGKNVNGKYGFLANGGDQDATDATEDFAFGLIEGSYRWHQDSYLEEAKKILPDIYKYDTSIINGKRYLIAGRWANRSQNIIVNPSYFRPAYWRIFSQVDKDSNDHWISLINPAYDFLSDSGRQTLNGKKGIGLVPDWLVINRETGDIEAPYDNGETDNNSYDSMRLEWEISFDYQLNHNQQAYDYLSTTCKFFDNQYKTTGKLAVAYGYDGSIVNGSEDPTRYATIIGCRVVDSAIAKSIYQDKILRLYSNSDNSFSNKLSYYPQNWLWFSVGLYNNFFVLYK